MAISKNKPNYMQELLKMLSGSNNRSGQLNTYGSNNAYANRPVTVQDGSTSGMNYYGSAYDKGQAPTIANGGATNFANGGNTGGDFTWSQKLFGGEDAQGNVIGGAAVPVAETILGAFNAYTSWEELKLAQDTFAHQSALDRTNLFNQGSLVNQRMEELFKLRKKSAEGGGYDPDAGTSVAQLLDERKVRTNLG